MEKECLSIEEIKQLQGNYNKLVEQNKSFQAELREKKQELDELSAGVLMIAEIIGLDVPKGTTANDIISEIAAALDENDEQEEV